MDLTGIGLLVASLLILGAATGSWSAAPWVPTRRRDWPTIDKLLGLQPNEKFYEIGCGNGCLLAYLAEKNPQSQLIGLEISPLLALAAAWRTRRFKNVQIRWANLWRHSLVEADAIYLFLMPKIYPRLIALFKKQLKPTTKIVFGDWPIKDKPAYREERQVGSVPYYLYRTIDL